MEAKGIQLTETAARSAEQLRASEPAYKDKSLRLYIDGKGCDGFYYGVTFDEPSKGDFHFESHGLTVLVDGDTMEFVDGSLIDWVSDERGRGFLVENPNHRKFRGKFYKRSAWQEKLIGKMERSKAAEP